MKKQLEAGVVVTPEQIEAILGSDLSKSKKMIAMFDLGMETKDISDIMTKFEGKLVRYNFVYNVLSNHCNINGIVRETAEKSGKKELILAMYLAGKSNKEISIDLKTNYNYVFNTIKNFKLLHPEMTPEKAAQLVQSETTIVVSDAQ